jgi:hypothetical protein
MYTAYPSHLDKDNLFSLAASGYKIPITYGKSEAKMI